VSLAQKARQQAHLCEELPRAPVAVGRLPRRLALGSRAARPRFCATTATATALLVDLRGEGYLGLGAPEVAVHRVVADRAVPENLPVVRVLFMI